MEINALSSSRQVYTVEPAADQHPNPAGNRELIQAVKSVNASESLGLDNELSFVMDRETRRPVIRIVNRKTKEVIRQVPPEYVLRLARDLAGK